MKKSSIFPPITGYKHRPAPQGSVSQFFGENKALYFSRMKMQGHNGIDIVAPHGTPIYAVEGGTVCDVKNSPDGYGKHIRIVTDTGREWTYGHASENLVKIGDVVKEGDNIQLMGNTGFVVSSSDGNGFWRLGSNKWAGTHLHLGLRLVKVSLKKKSGYWQYNAGTPWIKVLNYDNGFFGSVNFADLLSDGPIIVEPFLKDLKFGDRGSEVNRLQEELKKLGFFKGETSEFFGVQTRQAVKDFQNKYEQSILWSIGLKLPTGYFGKNTRKVINELLG
jgi:murein DD-endopeptidase MepM/ murein hydrolase activator NlpD